jgi:hypothetical protein
VKAASELRALRAMKDSSPPCNVADHCVVIPSEREDLKLLTCNSRLNSAGFDAYA